MFNEEISNAIITKTQITMEDHGVLTFWLFVEGDGWGTGIGGFVIGKGFVDAKEEDFTVTSGDGLIAIMKIMDIVGVETWEDLKGKYIRCKLNGVGKPVYCIGNLIKDKWFDIKSFFENRQKLLQSRGYEK